MPHFATTASFVVPSKNDLCLPKADKMMFSVSVNWRIRDSFRRASTSTYFQANMPVRPFSILS